MFTLQSRKMYMYCTIYDRTRQTKTSFLNTLYVSVCVVIAMTLETATVRRPLVSECFASGQGHKLEAPWKQSKKNLSYSLYMCKISRDAGGQVAHTHTNARIDTVAHTSVLCRGLCAAFQSASVCADRAGSPGFPDCSESAASGPRRRRSPDAGSCCCAPAAPPLHLRHAPAQLGQSTTGVKHAIYSTNSDEYAKAVST